MSNADQIERDVTRAREAVGRDVATLNDKASPASFLQRRRAKLQESGGTIKNRLMGSSDTAGGAAKDRAGSAVDAVKDATDSLGAKLGDSVSSDALRRQTQGNPVAAGLIAFGVGWLLSSLVPVSQVEQDAAAQVEDAVGDPLKQAAQDVAGNLQEPLKDSANTVKETATDAAATTSEHAKTAAADVQDDARKHVSS